MARKIQVEHRSDDGIESNFGMGDLIKASMAVSQYW
jgi:hypothetical protein